MGEVEATRQVAGMMSDRGIGLVAAAAVIVLLFVLVGILAATVRNLVKGLIEGKGRNGTRDKGLLQLHEKVDHLVEHQGEQRRWQQQLEARFRPLETIFWQEHPHTPCPTPEALAAAGEVGE